MYHALTLYGLGHMLDIAPANHSKYGFSGIKLNTYMYCTLYSFILLHMPLLHV